MQIFYFYIFCGILLITLEVAVTTFYLCIIGVVFIVAGFLGLFLNSWIIITGISVVLAGVACWLLKILKRRRRLVEPLIIGHLGHTVEVSEINHDKLRVKYSGSYWDAKLAKKDSRTLKVGDILTITKYHNNEFEID